jgi:type II secretory pathway pseudopilin PulG
MPGGLEIMNQSRPVFRPSRGFTYIELLALLGVAAILLSIFIPYLMSAREKDRRLRCEDNLRQLRDALQHYAHDNRNDYPRVRYDPAVNPNGYTAFTGVDAANPLAAPVASSDVTASLWLLVRGGYVKDLSTFICPSASSIPDQLTDSMGRAVPANQRSNFRSAINLSYSYASPFSGYAGYHINSDDLPGAFALMADKNPGSSSAAVAHDASPLELAKANSLNHQQAGQNVLYADGSIEFQTTPYCGVGRDVERHADGDNIYTALSLSPLISGNSPPYDGNGYCGKQYGPSYQYDSYLVPTQTDAP